MVAAVVGVFFVVLVLSDAFITIVLPRSVKRAWRIATVFYYLAWLGLRATDRLKPVGLRQAILVAYAPMLLIILIGIWALLLILGFGLIGYGLPIPLNGATTSPSFETHLYFSGVTFFTLGYGDLVPVTGAGKTLSVIEAGTGFGFLALVISYVPVLYGAFSRREVHILLLDSKAGSDPSAAELLRRYAEAGCVSEMTPLLREWEQFAAELMESYLSYPLLAYYRSQHDHQSWLRSLTAIMDTCAIIEAGFTGGPEWEHALRFQARNTFAMARHLVVDLAYVLDAEPEKAKTPRLTAERWQSIREELRAHGVMLDDSPEALDRFKKIHDSYEPYCVGLAHDLLMPLPEWIPDHRVLDNWQTSAWDGMHF